jgi:hypothetical protein
MNKVLVRYSDRQLTVGECNAIANKISVWWKGHIPYELEWAYIGGSRVGVYLLPEDATLFKLTFQNVFNR